ncbi:E3 ubiquitin-protein ligase RMA1 [Apostasia shenzhenica]|uniref:E3 ubiquitin-protein ligase RMA n=1 Tax=Apostasia shenzhenica TaxID=1088818 RepID=A0A2I0ACH9_9ASPA|nr:E3 ubiquitin-protein ligase RMA1 [Apostasia shenzhenica]
MADEGNESRAGRMDLNLYLGLPRSPRPRSLDLGSDLALSSLPMSASSDSEESRAPVAAPCRTEASASHAPYSPSHVPLAPPPPDVNPGHEYTPFFPSYESNASPFAQETETPVTPYSPSNVSAVPIEQEVLGDDERDGVPNPPFDEVSPLNLIDYSSAQRDGNRLQYSPAYFPEENFTSLSSIPLQIGNDFPSGDDGSSSQRELLQSPEFRIRRLIESQQWRLRRFRSSRANGGERPDFARHSSPRPEELIPDALRSLETSGKHKLCTEISSVENTEEDIKMRAKTAVNFECNICLEMAKEPVVTSCGHLFCWPCLYQWLYVHSDHKECPVCKGEVTDCNIIPIYGRGSTGSDVENKDSENRDLGLEIPPRPRGDRRESWRQHLRPISRRFGEGIRNSWRRLLSLQVRNRNRFLGHEDAIVQDMLDGESHAVLTRSITRRLLREEGIGGNLTANEEIGFAGSNASVPRSSDIDPVFQDGIDLWHRLYGFQGTDRLAAITADIGRAVGRFSGSNNRYGASSSSFNVANPDQFQNRPSIGATAADQASASSTVAVIQGESSFRDASADPNSAGSSRPYRRRGRSSASGSADPDGGDLHARKRRRLN